MVNNLNAVLMGKRLFFIAIINKMVLNVQLHDIKRLLIVKIVKESIVKKIDFYIRENLFVIEMNLMEKYC